MKPLTCIIVDDEPLAVRMLETYVSRTPDLECAASYNDPVLALTRLKESPVDLVFLDIQMPDLDGLSLSQMVPPQTKVIFTTAFKQYALDSYEVSALDFLLKPIRYVKFLGAVEKARAWQAMAQAREELATTRTQLAATQQELDTTQQELNTAQQELTTVQQELDTVQQQLGAEAPAPDGQTRTATASSTKDGRDSIFVRVDSELRQVDVSRILYVEGMKDYVRIHLVGESRPLITHATMRAMEDILPASAGFMRVHRSYIVALDKVRSVDRNSCIRIGDEVIRVTDAYRPAFEAYLRANLLG